MEDDFVRGNTQISKHVSFSMYDVINKIEAYLNSQFTSSSGSKDSQGRDKPFFNIVVAAANIWQRATDIDRKDIRIRATKSKDFVDSFLATVHVWDWMRRENFGAFLNEWGRVLARYGSAVVEFVETDGKLHISVWPWNRCIVDSVEFDPNPKIKVLELTEAQLRQNESYDEDMVEKLISAKKTRETTDKRQKDTKSDYYKLYELHGNLSRAVYKTSKGQEPAKGDEKIYFEQMHVLSFVGGQSKGRGQKADNEDFILFSGKKGKQTQVLTHLIKEDGRVLSIGAVEHLFESQWMMNHTAKAIKDQLDLASKLIFQTADDTFVGENVLVSIENGEILIHKPNMPLTQVNNTSHDTASLQNFGQMWKIQGNEIVGISEAMLGGAPKSGTAWRQTEALLVESHNLFEHMTENKALHLEQMFREFVIPFVKKKMDTSEEVSATLELHDLSRIDGMYIKNLSKKLVNSRMKEMMIAGEMPSPEQFALMNMETEADIQDALSGLGNQRFFKPSEIDTKTWKKQFKDLEWNLEIDISGEVKNVQDAMATLGTALKVVADPGYAQNKHAQKVVGKILELSGTMSPLELSSMGDMRPSPIQPQNVELPVKQ